MFKRAIVVFLFLFSFYCHAGTVDDTLVKIKEGIRPYMIKIIGKVRTNSILGTAKGELKLPPIPSINRDAKALTHFRANSNQKSIPKDDKKKYDYLFLQELYNSTVRMKANSNEIANWMNVLEQGGTREGVYRALVLNETYGGLENYESPLNDTAIEFSIYFMEKYLGRKITKNRLETINMYSLKRIVVERALEVADTYLLANPDDLYTWYAILSSDLASRYSQMWKSRIRKEKSAGQHRGWAKNVPEQHIKSELIIKLHKVFNYIML